MERRPTPVPRHDEWLATVWRTAGEASVTYSPCFARREPMVGAPARPRLPTSFDLSGPRGLTFERRARAASRAATAIRRYVVSNHCTFMWTLTYRDPVFDRSRVGRDFALFARSLTRAFRRQPWVRVIETHPGGHGHHIHLAVRQFLPEVVIAAAWPHGHVAGRKWRDWSSAMDDARSAARYLTKEFGREALALRRGEHLYEVAQGFRPRAERLRASSAWEARVAAIQLMGAGRPSLERSYEPTELGRPPSLFMSWPSPAP